MAYDRKKVSPDQLSVLIEEVEKDPSLLNTRILGKAKKALQSEKWKALAQKLNSVENGTMKNVSKWQQAWRDWKSNTKKKAKSCDAQELNGAELRLLELLNMQPVESKCGGIEINTIAEVDPLSSDDSDADHTDEVTVYSRVRNERGKTAAPDDHDSAPIRRKRMRIFSDDSTHQQTELLSRLTKLETSRAAMDKRNLESLQRLSEALIRLAVSAERQAKLAERLLAETERQAEATERHAAAVERHAAAAERQAVAAEGHLAAVDRQADAELRQLVLAERLAAAEKRQTDLMAEKLELMKRRIDNDF